MAAYKHDVEDHSTQSRISSGINAALGVWLILSPWYYDFAAMSWNNIIVGLAVLTCGWIRFVWPHARVGLSWTNIALGAWTVLAPLAFNLTANALPLWNALIIGPLIMILAIWSGTATVAEHRQHVI